MQKVHNEPVEGLKNIYCLAKNRQGRACRRRKAKGKNRCYMHGGAPGSGAQYGNSNALKHGKYTAEAIRMRKEVKQMMREFKEWEKQYQ